MERVDEYYKRTLEICREISASSLTSDNLSLIGKSHSSIEDFGTWMQVLKDEPVAPIIKMALREYQMSILSNLFGLYNLAFVGLRFFLERTLIAIQFSAKEIDLRLWQRGERDTSWSEILNPDNGLFSLNFCKAFFPELKDEISHYKSMTEKVYRECSEYVHGNVSTQDKVPNNLSFSPYLLNEWHSKAATIRSIVIFAFCLRYLRNFTNEQLKIIEAPILDELSHIAPIRLRFEQSN